MTPFPLKHENPDIESGEMADVEPLVASPEALVRSDTRWINFLRFFLSVTLVVVAIGCSTSTHKMLAHVENETFHHEFETVSTRITQAFVQDLKLKMWFSRFVTLALSKQSGSNEGFFDVNLDMLEEMSSGVGGVTYWNRIGFSPLLWTESDRVSWEEYAVRTTGSQESNSHVCYVCGEGMKVGSPDRVVNIPTYGSFSCGVVEATGLRGSVPMPYCPLLAQFMKAPCQCQAASKHNIMDGKNASQFISKRIFGIKDGVRKTDKQPLPLSPVWKALPQPPNEALLYNQMSDPIRRRAIQEMVATKVPTFSQTRYPEGDYQHLMVEAIVQPQATIFYPVLNNKNNTTNNQTVVGSIAFDFGWNSVLGFGDKIPPKSAGILFVIENSIGQAFSYEIDDSQVVAFVGEGDLHEVHFDALKKGSSFEDMKNAILAALPKLGGEYPETALVYSIRVYPSAKFKSQFITTRPIYYALAVLCIFLFTSAIFITYDLFVRRRQLKVLESAVQSNKIVTSMFPDFITSRLLKNSKHQDNNTRSLSLLPWETPKNQLRQLLGPSENIENLACYLEPIADFFPNVTVVFADIAGFTAWSSEREPVQVFQLLETVYQTFDQIAAKHGVFKVETIGDCYVAVTGLPMVQPDHAVRMARFAYDIMVHMHELAASLESMLGPGTGSLSIRVGLHSGPVTGGVLRGEKARFQLFGDTMNTAARMQSAGVVNAIQASESTASLLVDAGFSRWVDRREQQVHVEGKGDMQTYWIDLATSPVEAENSVVGLAFESLPDEDATAANEGIERLVKWNTDLLEKFLKKVVAARRASQRRHRRVSRQLDPANIGRGKPLDDVAEVIEMSKFCETTAHRQVEPESVELDDTASLQLRKYVGRIASMYRDNPFHNFEHASHVVMSANKIIKRIIKPDGIEYPQESVRKKDRKKVVAEQIHFSTFGISSDALMQFAVLFSAVIHDVEHTGVSNAQLVKEESEVALTYSNKCVAEQNSIQIAWNLLMEDEFSALRACICSTSEELSRFRQLVVNAVIATDIADKELQMLRKNRWNKAFHEANEETLRYDDDNISCKATVAFEYIIQASDVAHTMQHWHVYNKWNERLFQERYVAYLAGREPVDPSVGWYEGEIWFYDNYVIPLARKLETCGVFGVSSDEYLNYALANRHEWERKGRDILEQLKERYKQKYTEYSICRTLGEAKEETNSNDW